MTSYSQVPLEKCKGTHGFHVFEYENKEKDGIITYQVYGCRFCQVKKYIGSN